MIRALTILAFLFPILGLAEPVQPPVAPDPAKVLEQAEVDLAALLKVTSDLKRFIPKMRSKEEIFPYVKILPELERVTAKYDTASFGMDPVKDLGRLLTGDAVRWVELDNDPQEIVEIFLRRASNDTRYTMASAQVKRLNPLDGKERLLVWHANVDRALRFLQTLQAEIPPSDPDATERIPSVAVMQKMEELQGRTVRMLLPHAKELPPEQVAAFFPTIRGETALEEVFDYLYTRSLEAETTEEINNLMSWILQVGKTAREQGEKLRYEVRVYPGRIILTLLANKLGRGEVLRAEEITPFMDLLVSSQLGELGDLLVRNYEFREVPDPEVEFVWMVSNRLMKRFTDQRMRGDLLDFEPFYKKLVSTHAAQEGRFEGTYDCLIGDEVGKQTKAKVTIASVGASNFIMGVNMEYGSSRKDEGLPVNFFDVVYDLDNDRYVGQYRAVEAPRFLHRTEQHQHIYFRLVRQPKVETPKGKYRLEGMILTGASPFHVAITGEQIETYPTYAPSLAPARDFTGTFVEDGPKGTRPNSWIILTKTGTSAGANMRFAKVGNWIPFEWGYFNAHRNAVYLSSGELPSGRWASVRGQLSDDGKVLNLSYIAGGVGLKQENVKYIRVR